MSNGLDLTPVNDEEIVYVSDPIAMEKTKAYEGFRPSIYKDTVGKRTIGYGFNVDDPSVSGLLPQDVVSGQRAISRPEADTVFEKLYARAQNDAADVFGQETYINLPSRVQNIVTDMSYNMGRNKLGGFKKAVGALKSGDYARFGDEIKDSNWFNQVGNRSKEHFATIQDIVKKNPKSAQLNLFEGTANAAETDPQYDGLDLTPADTVDTTGLDLQEIPATKAEAKPKDLRDLLSEDAATALKPLSPENVDSIKAGLLGAGEVVLSRTDLYKDPEVKKLMEEHPLAKGIGETARDLALLVPIGRALEGVASLPFIPQIASSIAKAAEGTAMGRRFLNPFEATRYVTKAIHSGATFGTLAAIKEAGIESPDQNVLNSAQNIVSNTIWGAGLGLATGAPNYLARVATAGSYGGVTTALNGGSPQDIALNTVLFGGFELIGGKTIDRKIKLQAMHNIRMATAEYLQKGGMDPMQSFRTADVAMNNSIKNSGGLENVLENNTAPFMNQLASEMQKVSPTWGISRPKFLPDYTEMKTASGEPAPIAPGGPSSEVNPIKEAAAPHPYLKPEDQKDITNLMDWESHMPNGEKWSFTNSEGQRQFEGSPSGHSATVQEFGPAASFQLLQKASKGEYITDSQKEKVQSLLEDYRANIKPHLESTLKEIDNAHKDLSESEAAEVIDAFKEEAGNTQYDWEGNVVDPAEAKANEGLDLQEIAPNLIKDSGKEIKWDDVVPEDAMRILNNRFTTYAGVEIPKELSDAGITLKNLIKGFEQLGGGEEIVKESTIALKNAGYKKIGNILLTENGSIPEPISLPSSTEKTSWQMSGEEKASVPATPAGKKLLDNLSPITSEFVRAFKYQNGGDFKDAKLSTYTDGEPYFKSQLGAEVSMRDYLKSKEESGKITQKDKVKASVSKEPKSIKQIAAETDILEPNIRRILGVGAKEGTFERVDTGVYILKNKGKDVAYILPGDSLEVLPRLVKEGFKADMVFLDIPYKTSAVISRGKTKQFQGVNYDLITPEQFDQVLQSIDKIVREVDSPVIYMFSQAKSGQKEMDKYTEMIADYFIPVARGEYQKIDKAGKPVRNMRGQVQAPEGIIVFNQSGNFSSKEAGDFKFKMVRPVGYTSEKPAEMLNKMIRMTTNEGDIILDPFAGSGVTVAEAAKSGRVGVGIEKSEKAIKEHIKPKLEGDDQKELFQKKNLGDAQGSSIVGSIDQYEPSVNTPGKKAAFKLSERVVELAKKYAERFGENYNPSGTEGVFFPRTDNIFVNAKNDIGTAAHEVTHYLDKKNGFTGSVMLVKGYAKNGKPIYDPSTKRIRSDLTNIYVKHYPGAKKDHPLKKRVQEGIAVFFQRMVTHPEQTIKDYPGIYRDFLHSTGQYFDPIMPDFVKEARAIVEDYQKLSDLDKIGARVVDAEVMNETPFLNAQEAAIYYNVDNKYPLEKLAKEAGVHFKKEDPSLIARIYDHVPMLIQHNLSDTPFIGIGPVGYGKQTYLTMKSDGEIGKKYDFNWHTLVNKVGGELDDFNNWLVARRVVANYKRLDVLKEQVKEAADIAKKMQEEAKEKGVEISVDKETVEKVKALMAEYKELAALVKNDRFDKEISKRAHDENVGRFKDVAKMFDDLVRADLDLVKNSGMIKDSKYQEMIKEEGYATFKRQIENELVGTGQGVNAPASFRVGKNKVSSLFKYGGSGKDIISPVYSSMINHQEIMKKSSRQMVYNGVAHIADKFPAIFQRVPLKSHREESGKTVYPQDKDPNIMMAYSNGKRIPYVVNKDLKTMLDTMLTPTSVGLTEKIFVGLAQAFTKGTTAFFYPFAATNFIIDQLSAASNSWTRFKPVYTPISELVKALSNRESEDAQFAIEYFMLGGERQAFLSFADLNPKEAYDFMRHEKNAIQKSLEVLNVGGDILAVPVKTTELLTRMSEFIRARKEGYSQLAALELAGRISTPFHHRGQKGDIYRFLTRSVPYLNASVQVLAQEARTLKSGKTRNRALFIMAAISAAMVAGVFSVLNATEDQKRLLKSLNTDKLARFIYFPSPDGQTLLKIRVPQEKGTFATVLNMAIIDATLNAKYSMYEYFKGATGWLPDQLNPTDIGRMLASWIPQAVSPAVQVAFNKRVYPTIRDLEPDYMKYLPRDQRVFETSSNMSKWLGPKLGLSPIQFDALIEGYTGRSLRYISGKELGNPFDEKMYLSASRQMIAFYAERAKNDEQYQQLKTNPDSFSKEEAGNIRRLHTHINHVEDLMKNYRKVTKDNKNDPALRDLRTKILDIVDAL